MSLRYARGGYFVFASIGRIRETVGENLSPEEAINAIQAFGQIN